MNLSALKGAKRQNLLNISRQKSQLLLNSEGLNTGEKTISNK